MDIKKKSTRADFLKVCKKKSFNLFLYFADYEI